MSSTRQFPYTLSTRRFQGGFLLYSWLIIVNVPASARLTSPIISVFRVYLPMSKHEMLLLAGIRSQRSQFSGFHHFQIVPTWTQFRRQLKSVVIESATKRSEHSQFGRCQSQLVCGLCSVQQWFGISDSEFNYTAMMTLIFILYKTMLNKLKFWSPFDSTWRSKGRNLETPLLGTRMVSGNRNWTRNMLDLHSVISSTYQ
jgi:hypothetical protein